MAKKFVGARRCECGKILKGIGRPNLSGLCFSCSIKYVNQKRSFERRRNKMGEIILKNAVQRKPGYLYYIDKDGNICEAKMVRRKKR